MPVFPVAWLSHFAVWNINPPPLVFNLWKTISTVLDKEGKKMRSTKPAVFIAAALGLMAATAVSTPAFASSQGSRNTAIALGAGAIYELSQHNTGAGLLLGLGAVVAEGQAQNHNDRDRDDRAYYHVGGDYRGGDNNWNRGGGDSRDSDRGGHDSDRGNDHDR
jgi:hypothetical protein